VVIAAVDVAILFFEHDHPALEVAMKREFRSRKRVFAGCLLLGMACVATAQTHPDMAEPNKDPKMTTHANGTFDVKLTPQATDDKDAPVGRMTIDKQFHGDIEGTSKGEMLAAMTSVKGSAGYVAIEKVTGTLKGRRGTFVLQHTGTMNRGTPQLSVTVVPDSGTEELAGLSGNFTIKIVDGKHFYEFEYAIGEAH
jgi:Protein of unknown function (DUF3224)